MKKILLYISILIIIISCSSKKEEISPSENIVVNMGSDPTTIDPTLNDIGVVSTYILHAFEGLTKTDKNNDIIPGIAEKWDVSEDGLTYTFHLRTNAKWSDGKPVTAYDFQYSWRRAVNPQTDASFAYMMEIIKNATNIRLGTMDITNLGVNVIDDYTLKVELENPSLFFLDFAASTGIFVPLREDIIKEYGDEWTLSPKTYVCNGQYVLKERVPGEKIVYEENTNYYDKEEIVAKRITFVSDNNVANIIDQIFQNKVYFSALEPPANELEYLTGKGYIKPNDAIGTIYLELNITNEGLNDKRVRQALSLAIDRRYIVNNIVRGAQTSAGAFVPPAVKGIKHSFRDESSNFIELNNYQANIEKAKALMAEAGYSNGQNYPVLTLKVFPGIFYEVGKTIQQMWKEALNIDIKLEEEEFPATLLALTRKKYQIARMGWTGDYYDPMTMLDIMVSYGGVNHSGFSNAQYDNLILEAKKSHDNNLRMQNMRQAEAILLDEMPIIPLYYKADSLIVNPNLKGLVLNPLGRHRFNYCSVDIVTNTTAK